MLIRPKTLVNISIITYSDFADFNLELNIF